MTPEVTKTVLNKIILNGWIEIWHRDRASISVQQFCIIQESATFSETLVMKLNEIYLNTGNAVFHVVTQNLSIF
jgi:hypothetical protein